MEINGAKIYMLNEAKLSEGRTERLMRLAYEYAEGEGIPLPDRLNIARGKFGKPYFENAPWLHFSVSHSGDIWACALCRFEVGIDIERVAKRDHVSLAQRFFSTEEIKHVSSDANAFYSVWTAKESYVKLLGTGIGGSFSHFSVIHAGRIDGEHLFARFDAIPAPHGYTFTLCRWADEII